MFALSVFGSLLAQYIADSTGASLSGIWVPGETTEAGGVLALSLGGYFLRALGMILIGAGIYRSGFLSGGFPSKRYRLIAIAGLASGLALAAIGVIVTAAGDYSREVAFIGQVPNTLGTIPASL